MSRASGSSFADFFPHAPDSLQKKRKQSSHEDNRSGAQGSRQPTSLSPSPSNKRARKEHSPDHVNGTIGAFKPSSSKPLPHDDNVSSRGENGDTLTGVGSASSNASTVPSVFSTGPPDMATYSSMPAHPHALTPLTNTDASSPNGKIRSPSLAGIDRASKNGAHYPAADSTSNNASESINPILTPPESYRQPRPDPGVEKGAKLVWDPELDEKLSAKDKKRHKPKYKTFGTEAESFPPPDPRLAIAGYTEGLYNRKGVQNKAKLRHAPYIAKMHAHDPRNDDDSFAPPKRVVVTGLDPLTPEAHIRTVFGTYGEIAEFINQTDPASGSFLGICSIRYADSNPLRGTSTLAVTAAMRAEQEGTGQKIGFNIMRVQRDRTGMLCQRLVIDRINKTRAAKERELQLEQKRMPAPASVPQPPPDGAALEGPPPDAPKGPSGRGAPPVIVAAATATVPRPRFDPAFKPMRNPHYSLVEQEPILPKLKRRPYIFIASFYVPVLGTTIPHLQRRMRSYDVRETRCDSTGYYLVFDDSKRGEDECLRAYQECNMFALFTYVMNMECEQYGNPNYERSPSPERVLAEKKKNAERERIRKEDELDFEQEKKQRAEDLDPVKGALEMLKSQLRDIIMSDVKAKLAGPALYDLLNPDRHAEKRRKYNIEDPRVKEAPAPALPFNRGDVSPSVASFGKLGFPTRGRGFGSRFDRGGRRHGLLEHKAPINAFLDERRSKRPPPTRRPAIQSLHRRLMHFDESDDESDDDKRTMRTKDSGDLESTPLSRASPAPSKVGDDDLASRGKRRGVEAAWGADSDDEQIEAIARRSLGHLVGKEPEDMANHELEQVLCTLPRSSTLRQRAAAEVRLRKRNAEEDDVLFFGKPVTPSAIDADVQMDDAVSMDMSMATPEPEAVPKSKKKAAVARPKKKTKKELLAEAAALKADAKAKGVAPEVIAENLEELVPVEIKWSVSKGKIRRTVEDDPALVLDVDGWQHLVKDEEDLRLLQTLLLEGPATAIGDADLWAYKQKQVKTLNNGGVQGPVFSTPKIEGYYVPNSTGSARTEGFKKILQSEKSKYLPHRLRVQREREERQQNAKFDVPATFVESTKAAAFKSLPTASSRANRLNNRRLANDITLQKVTLGADTDTLRFNQLLKRKKNVRFDRSAIHNWGLYAGEDIQNNDFIIEYVGEKVRQRVANLREERYLKQGIGSSYLFRIGDDAVIDATKKGGIARFINHSCTPNCTAKIIRSEGTLRICIYSCRDIAKDEELTYDYKFEREINSDDRIPCLCGSIGCKGFLN